MLLDRVKVEAERILTIPGLREAVAATLIEQARITERIFGGTIETAWKTISGQ